MDKQAREQIKNRILLAQNPADVWACEKTMFRLLISQPWPDDKPGH
jgi:hypothetical protein